MPTDLSPLEWTRQIGYLYPPEIFTAALRATFPKLRPERGRLSAIESTCLGVYVGERETRFGGSADAAWLVLTGEKPEIA